MKLAPAILAEKIAGAPVLIVVLERDQRIEYLEYLAANRADVGRRE